MFWDKDDTAQNYCLNTANLARRRTVVRNAFLGELPFIIYLGSLQGYYKGLGRIAVLLTDVAKRDLEIDLKHVTNCEGAPN